MNKKLVPLYFRLMRNPRYQSFRRFLSEAKRLVMFRRHVIDVFLQLDDPYSYLLSHYLQHLANAYNVELRIYLSQALRGDF